MSPDGIEPTLSAWKAEVLTIRRRANKMLGGIGRRIGFKIQFSLESTGSSPVATINKKVRSYNGKYIGLQNWKWQFNSVSTLKLFLKISDQHYKHRINKY